MTIGDRAAATKFAAYGASLHDGSRAARAGFIIIACSGIAEI